MQALPQECGVDVVNPLALHVKQQFYMQKCCICIMLLLLCYDALVKNTKKHTIDVNV